MTGKIDKQVLEKFNIFQEHEKGEAYRDLDLESVEFEKVALSDERYFELTMGQSPDGNKLNKEGKGIPFYQGKTDFGSIYLESPTTWTTQSKKTAQVDDILMSLRAPAGVVNIANIDLSIGRGLASIRCLKNIEKFFIFNFLKNNENKIGQENDKGGFFTSMTKDYLENLTIPIPKSQGDYTSYDIQKAIVEFLEFWKVEFTEVYRNKIAKIRPILETMKKNLIASTFRLDSKIVESFNAFVKDEGFDVRLEDIEFKETQLSDKSYFALIMGQSPESKYLNKIKSGMPFYQGKTDFGDIYTNPPTTWTTHSKKDALKNDILISLRAPAGVVNIASIDMSIGRGIASIRCTNLLNNTYLFQILKMNESKINNENENGGFFTSMTKDYLENFKISIPKHKNYASIDLQNLLVSYWEMVLGNFEKREKLFDRALELCDKIDEAFLYRTFSKIKWRK